MSKAGEKGCVDSDTCAGVTFANFKTLSQEQVSELIKKAAIRCYTSCTGYRLGNALVLRFYYLFLRPSMDSRQRI